MLVPKIQKEFIQSESCYAYPDHNSFVVIHNFQFSLVNIDRSRSFYVLSWENQGNIVNSESDFALKDVYSIERLNPEAINVRVAEQIEKKLLSLDGNLVPTTSFGKLAVLVAEKLSDIFKLQNWELNKK